MIPAASILAVALVLVVSALLASKTRLALVLGVANLALPFLIPDIAGAHFVAALGAAWGLVRLRDLTRDDPPRAPLVRIWQAFAGFDTRTTTLGTPTFGARLLITGLVFGGITAASILGVGMMAKAASLPFATPIRWGIGAVFAYCSADAIDRLVRFGYGLAGLTVPPIQSNPIMARTVAEFWGARWNGIVSMQLRRDVFLPVARRAGAGAGLVAAFAASALLHAYLTAPAVGFAMAAWMAAFFLSQCVLVFVERVLRVGRWPAPLAHGWVVVTLLATSPLFVEPVLRVMYGP